MKNRNICLWCNKSNTSEPHATCEWRMVEQVEEANMLSGLTIEEVI